MAGSDSWVAKSGRSVARSESCGQIGETGSYCGSERRVAWPEIWVARSDTWVARSVRWVARSERWGTVGQRDRGLDQNTG